MSMEEFDAQVAWPRDQPSSSGGGEASTAQEPVIEEPPATATEDEDELTPPTHDALLYYNGKWNMPHQNNFVGYAFYKWC